MSEIKEAAKIVAASINRLTDEARRMRRLAAREFDVLDDDSPVLAYATVAPEIPKTKPVYDQEELGAIVTDVVSQILKQLDGRRPTGNFSVEPIDGRKQLRVVKDDDAQEFFPSEYGVAVTIEVE